MVICWAPSILFALVLPELISAYTISLAFSTARFYTSKLNAAPMVIAHSTIRVFSLTHACSVYRCLCSCVGLRFLLWMDVCIYFDPEVR